MDLFEKIRKNDFSEMFSERPWIIVAPTYAWNIPHIMQEWIENTTFWGNTDIYFIMTCGGSIGNAGKYLEKLCMKKKMNYCGCMGIVMPENYIALFSAPAEEEALQIIAQAEDIIDNAVLYIKKGNKIPRPDISFRDKINSGVVNAIFYPMLFMQKSFMPPAIAFPVVNVPASVPLTIFVSKAESLYGRIVVRIVWHASAAVQKKRSNMENTAEG